MEISKYLVLYRIYLLGILSSKFFLCEGAGGGAGGFFFRSMKSRSSHPQTRVGRAGPN